MAAFDQEIVSGSLLRSVWKIAWPVTLLNLINGMHGFANQIVVGKYVVSSGNAANAAIGVSWQVFLVLVVFISAIFHGMNVLISQAAGNQDRETLSSAAYNAFLTALYILLFIVAPVGYLVAPYLLDWMHTAPDVREFALPYLRILLVSCTPMFLMFMVTGAFQASGEPKIPLVLGGMTSALNVLLTIGFVTGWGFFPAFGAIGGAVAAALAPVPAVVASLWLIVARKTLIQPPTKYTLFPDLRLLRTIAQIGIPSGIQGVVLNIGGVMLMWFINQLELKTAALAAYTLCYTQIFNLVTWTSFGLRAACATLMGQNIGAGKPQRGKQAVSLAAGLGMLWAGVLALLFWFQPEMLLGLFNAAPETLAIGKVLLHYLAFSGMLLAVGLALTGGLQGAGETVRPMYIAIVTQIIILLGICEAYRLFSTLTPERIWFAILISHLSRLILTYAVFRTDGWARSRLDLVRED